MVLAILIAWHGDLYIDDFLICGDHMADDQSESACTPEPSRIGLILITIDCRVSCLCVKSGLVRRPFKFLSPYIVYSIPVSLYPGLGLIPSHNLDPQPPTLSHPLSA